MSNIKEEIIEIRKKGPYTLHMHETWGEITITTLSGDVGTYCGLSKCVLAAWSSITNTLNTPKDTYIFNEKRQFCHVIFKDKGCMGMVK